MGGPALHVALLSGRLDRARYETLLVHGTVARGEAEFEELRDLAGVRRLSLPELHPELDPLDDARSLRRLAGIVRAFDPDVVHTHTAKAGVLGRLAALAAPGRRPIVLHTYHGHVLEGYFGAAKSRLYQGIERALARVSDCLVGVSQATVDDLVRLGVAPPEKFSVIPLGLDLNPFLDSRREARERLRLEVGAAPDEVLLTFVGRLAPIKRVDLLLRSFARARVNGVPVRLAVVGDGEQRRPLEALARDLDISDRVAFLGYRDDVASVAAAADVAVLSSANEGTPVSLIEAAAAGRPAVATAVGGVRDVVTPETGVLVPNGNERALADGISRLAGDAALRERMGVVARDHVRKRYAAERLVRDVESLYAELLASKARL